MVLVCSMVFASGCASVKESILTGVGAGAVTGFVLGPAVERNASDARLGGALIGAAVGGIAAYFVHKGLDDRDSRVRKETLFNLDKYNVSQPSGSGSGMDYEYGIAPAGVTTDCFPTEIRGDKLVQAHCESKITGTPEWVKTNGKKKAADE